jgi:DNA repair protein RecO (recombination protein O)
MARATIELVQSRTTLATDRATAAALDYLTALVAFTVEEGSSHPRLYSALDAILNAMVLDLDDGAWWAGVAHFELLVLAELGFGLDLSSCAATGMRATEADLAFVSPRSSQAVGRAAGAPYAGKLLPLPVFLLQGGRATRSEIHAALRTTGFFLEREVLIGRAAALLPARARLIAMV